MWRQTLTINNDSPSGTSGEGWIRSECLSERAQDKPGPVPLPHRTGGSSRATEERQPPSSHARKSARADSRASTRMTAKFFTKKRRSGSTKVPSSTDTKQTVPWPRGRTPVTTASGARRRQWSSITPSCYTVRQKGNRSHR